MNKLIIFNFEQHEIRVIGSDENPHWIGRDVAIALGYKKTRNAIKIHVCDKDKLTIKDYNNRLEIGPLDFNRPEIGPLNLKPQTIIINESGLYSLIFSSKLEVAKRFKHWVTSEILPSIRKRDQKQIENSVTNTLIFKICTEYDLQIKVVNFIRSMYPSVLFTTTSGDLQDTSEKRLKCWYMGYTAGSADLLIFQNNLSYNGIVIEFKTPKGNGIISNKQEQFLKRMEEQKFKIIVSNNYDFIIKELVSYMYDK